MRLKKERVEELLLKFITGEISAAEQELLKAWGGKEKWKAELVRACNPVNLDKDFACKQPATDASRNLKDKLFTKIGNK